jgi:hypothetical protein
MFKSYSDPKNEFQALADLLRRFPLPDKKFHGNSIIFSEIFFSNFFVPTAFHSQFGVLMPANIWGTYACEYLGGLGPPRWFGSRMDKDQPYAGPTASCCGIIGTHII